jgi:hypothetical protein
MLAIHYFLQPAQADFSDDFSVLTSSLVDQEVFLLELIGR